MEPLTPGSAGDLPPLGELIVDVPFWRHLCASGPFFSAGSSRPPCCRHSLAGQGYRTASPVTARPMIMRWISEVPSKMVKIFASRCHRSTG